MGEKVSNLFADHPSTQFCFLLGAFFATDWQVQSMSTAHVYGPCMQPLSFPVPTEE
jgi:hypothetical protein